MAIANYSDLLSAVANWLNRSDLTDRIPEFIVLFEARMNRLLRVPSMEVTQTTSTSSETNALPSDCLSVREVYIDGNPDTVLEPMTPADMRSRYPYSSTGQPAAYTISGTNLKLAPAPSEAVTLVISYYRQIPALTASNTTNWLLTAHPDAYLMGTLCEANAYLVDDERTGVWKSAWDEILAEIQDNGRKYRTPGAPLVMRGAIEGLRSNRVI